ncbi:MAG: ABC transporter, partial [Vicingaceae bacterium]
DRLNYAKLNINDSEKKEELEKAIVLLKNEIAKENSRNNQIQFEDIEAIDFSSITAEELEQIDDYLDQLNLYYINTFKKYSDEKDKLLIELNKTKEDKEKFIEMKNQYTNEALENLVTNKNDLDKIIEWHGELIQRADPIYKNPQGFRAHFLAPSKKLFGFYITTFSANLIVLWLFSILLAITLYYDALRKLIESLSNLFKR